MSIWLLSLLCLEKTNLYRKVFCKWLILKFHGKRSFEVSIGLFAPVLFTLIRKTHIIIGKSVNLEDSCKEDIQF